jgi:hypothetical protein
MDKDPFKDPGDLARAQGASKALTWAANELSKLAIEKAEVST